MVLEGDVNRHCVSEQLRWSVGWAHHGRRAAKYFPVKLFGMREGYDMAVRFKSTKAVALEAAAPLLGDPGQAADLPATGGRRTDLASDGPAAAGALRPPAGTSVAPVAAERALIPIRCPINSTTISVPSIHGWKAGMELPSPAYQEDPLGGGSLVGANDRRKAAAGEVAHATVTCSAELLPPCSSSGRLAPPWQDPLSTMQGGKAEGGASASDGHASASSGPEPLVHCSPAGLFCSLTGRVRWPYAPLGAADQRKLWSPEHLCAPDCMGNRDAQTSRAYPLAAPDTCRATSSQGTPPQPCRVPVRSPPFLHHKLHDPPQSEGSTLPFCLPEQLESRGADDLPDTMALAAPSAMLAGSQGSLNTENRRIPMCPLSEPECLLQDMYGHGGQPSAKPESNRVGQFHGPSFLSALSTSFEWTK